MRRIVSIAESFPGARSAIDLFSGTSRVGHTLKQAGFQVFSNDVNNMPTCSRPVTCKRISKMSANMRNC